jgi:nucleotide-binding universal stress UspA family protein
MAVDLAWLLACQSSGLICLLHVLEPVPFISALRTSPLFRSDLKVARAAMRQLRRMADSLHDPRVTVGAMVRTGDPAREICNVAELLDADLIVLSLRRSSSFDRFFRRAIAEAVLRRATTAVLVLPSGGSTAVNAPHA